MIESYKDFERIKNKEGFNCIHLACDLGKDEIVEFLFSKIKNFN